MNNTYVPSYTYNNRSWYIIDGHGKRLGRLASEIATALIGKHKIDYHPSVDTGDYVIVINAKEIRLTGLKEKQKIYFSHRTSRPGRSKRESFNELMNRIPERIIEKGVRRMLPKGPLGRAQAKRLKVYSGSIHPHHSQKPKLFDLYVK